MLPSVWGAVSEELAALSCSPCVKLLPAASLDLPGTTLVRIFVRLMLWPFLASPAPCLAALLASSVLLAKVANASTSPARDSASNKPACFLSIIATCPSLPLTPG